MKNSIYKNPNWHFLHYDGRKKAFRGITREEFEAAQRKHYERCGRSTPTLQYIYEYRRRMIAYFAEIPYEYHGDGMDDYNKYQRPSDDGRWYLAICPGEPYNDIYVFDPILVAFLTKKYNNHFGNK